MLFCGFQASSWEHYLSHNDRGWAVIKSPELCHIKDLPPMKLVSCSNIPLCGFRHSHQIFSMDFGLMCLIYPQDILLKQGAGITTFKR